MCWRTLRRVRFFLLWLLLLLLLWLMVLDAICWIFQTGMTVEDNKDCMMVLVDFLSTVPGSNCSPAGPHILTTEDVVDACVIPECFYR